MITESSHNVFDMFQEVITPSHDVPFDWDRAVVSWHQAREKTPPTSAAQIRENVAEEISAILLLQYRFQRRHLKEILSLLIWKYTEADGKYNSRYITRGALDLIANSPDRTSNLLRHEHVWERDLVVETLLTWPDSVRKILESVVSCTVTIDESLELNLATHMISTGDRWARYRYAGIEVIDRHQK